MRYTWTTRADGSVHVRAADGRPVRLVLDVENPAIARDVARVEQWRPIATRHARRTGVPVALLLGMIYAESRGHSDVVETLPDGSRGPGEGLMQLTHSSLKAKVRPGESIFDPEVNIRIGSDYAAEIWLRREVRRDTPRTVASYNHGHVEASHAEPWGLVATGDHITRAVAGANTFAARSPGGRGAGVALAALAALYVFSKELPS